MQSTFGTIPISAVQVAMTATQRAGTAKEGERGGDLLGDFAFVVDYEAFERD